MKDRDSKGMATSGINPEVSKNSNFKITRRADSLNSLDFMFQGSEHKNNYAQHNFVFQEMK
jgi:hypothetical protein